MKKIIALMLAMIMVIGMLAACGPAETPDDDDDDVDDPTGPSEVVYPWSTTDLLYELSEDSNNRELSCFNARYLAGTAGSSGVGYSELIDTKVATRNAAALAKTKVNIEYIYLPDAAGYGWNANTDRIYTLVTSGATDIPDIFCNHAYDMYNTSMKGSFANLLSESYGTGENYFAFKNANYDAATDDLGYFYDYMVASTLSVKKIYCYASDYTTDFLRAMFVTPINLTLLGTISVADSTGDKDGDNDFDVYDFYEMIWDNEWTHETMTKFNAAIYADDGDGVADLEDTLGIAINYNNGLPSSGLVYTSSITFVDRTWNETKGDYDYVYPKENAEFDKLATSLTEMLHKTGALVVSTNDEKAITGQSKALLGVRQQFSQDKMLFGGVIMVGSLEDAIYQDMENGFGIAPLPLYEYVGKSYQTIIHNVAQIVAISVNTAKFAQCTAFLDYMAQNSSEILEDYYYQLQYNAAGGATYNVEMLDFLRDHIRDCFDKTIDDALSRYFRTENQEVTTWTFAGFMSNAQYNVTNCREKYAAIIDQKNNNLQRLVAEYANLPA
jgi:predicted small lipoprotein YifL